MLEAVERKIEQFVADLNDAEVTKLYTQLPHGKRLRAKLILKIAG
ncbi:MAG: polyprenyl synthetase family protein, partial [Sulfurovum sp.]|nr:polyprenyl synthetase family protein [Sulfurovum sp.]